MGMRWQLYDPDFYTDVIFGFENEEEESEEEVIICKCSGRGKTDEERWMPRMPRIKPNLEVPVKSNEPVVRKRSKGRGRLLKEKAESLPVGIGSGWGLKDQQTANIRRIRGEPLFLDNSSFVEKVDYVRPSPFASLSNTLSKQVMSSTPPSSDMFEEDFPSLSSSTSAPYTAQNQKYADVVNSLSESDSRSTSLTDFSDLAHILKSSPSVTCSSVSPGTRDSSPEKSVTSKSTSCPVTTSSDDVLYTSDSESTYSRSSEASQNHWSLIQGNVVQLEGLPKGFDLSILEELIAQYGTIQETQIRECEDSVAIRFRLTSEDACDWVVSCLDGTDCLFPESTRTLSCCKV